MNENLMRLILPQRSCRYPEYMPSDCADNDRSLIFPIIILLIAENADFFLIFALLYILM